MRVTTKGARTFFLLMLTVLAILGIYQCFTMANAFNLSPYTFKLRAKGVATDSVSIYGGSLHAEHVDSVIVVTLRAGDKVVTDTIQGAGSVVGIVDDTLRLDADSTGAYAIITFGGWGGGIRWNQSSDAMEFTNDFATWTTFGSGSGTGDIEGVTAGNGLSGGGTSGTPTLDVRPGWGLEINNDSVRVNASQVSTLVGSGGESDSNAIIYSTDRVQPYSDTGIYIGGTSDEMMMDFTRADTILAFVGVFYGEGVADSMLMSKAWIEGIVGDSVAGKIDGINSSNGITGSASAGVANIQIDWQWLYGFNDTMSAEVKYAGSADSVWAPSNAWVTAFNGNVVISAPSPANGGLQINVGSAANQLSVDTGSVRFNRRLTMNSDTIQDFTGDGLSVVSKVLTATLGTAITSDEITDGTIAAGDLASDAVTEAKLKAVNTAVDEDILTYESTTGDFEWHTPSELGLLTSETGDISNVGVTAPITGGGSSGSVTVGFDWAWLYGFIDTSRARIPASDTAYVVLHSFLYNYLDTSRARIPAADTAYTVVVNSIDSTHIKPNSVLKSELAIESVDSTKIIASSVLSPEIADGSIALADYGANSIDSTKIMPSSIKASELAVNVVDSTHLTANSVLASEIATGAVATAEILDGTIALADYGANSIDSTKIMPSSIKASELSVNVVDSTHLTANSVLASEIATGAVATAEILDQTIVLADVDSTGHLAMNNARVNGILYVDTINGGQGLQVSNSIILGTDITDTIRRDIQIPEYKSVVYPRGYHATDIAAYDSTKMTIRPGHDANGSYIVCIDSLVWATDHSRYAVLGFPMPEGAVRLNRILIQASSAENVVDSGVVWAGLKKNSVDSAGAAFHLEDLADRDSTSTSALDTLVLDNTGGLVAESYTEGDVAYVVVRFTTRAGNGRSGVASYYIRKAWAEWVRNKL